MKKKNSEVEQYNFDLKAEVDGFIQHFDELFQSNTKKTQHREKACRLVRALKGEHDITDYENTIDEFHKEYVEALVQNMKNSPATTFEAVVIDSSRLIEIQIAQGVKDKKAEEQILGNLDRMLMDGQTKMKKIANPVKVDKLAYVNSFENNRTIIR